MTKNMKLLLTQGMMIWAFSCAVNGYPAAAAAIGVLTVLADMCIFGVPRIPGNIAPLAVSAFAQMCAVRLSGLSVRMPVIGLLVIVSAVHAVLWGREKIELIASAANTLTAVMLGFYTLALMIPDAALPFAEMTVLLSVIFLPVCGGYLLRAARAAQGTKGIEQKTQLR